MVRAIAFDFDGVLIESEAIKTSAFTALFAAEEPAVARQIVAYHQAHGGVSRFEKFRTIYRDILRRPLDEATYRKLCDRFAALVVRRLVAAPWVEGAEEFLLAHRGRYRFFVVSGSPEAELKDVIRCRRMDHFFDEVLGAPPHKAALLQGLLERQRLQPWEVIMVGDAQTDWLAARQFAVPFIWRPSPGTPAVEGFVGPTIASLAHLARALEAFGADSS
ncbi:MAG: HAD family hydrolase [Candidatus Omnitrophica bacterium]|nr:HAD family hydrolase [Candidatus Omnitrophota bacterium]